MGAPRSSHISVVLQDGRVLVVGGFTSGGVVNSAEIFDPALNSWSNVSGGMVEARAGAAAVLLNDGRVLINGGQGSSGTVSQSAEIFDPASGAFSFVGALSSARKSHAAALLSDGRVLVVGGNHVVTNPGGSSSPIDLASAEILDAGATAFSPAASALLTARSGHQAFLLPHNNGVLIVGGTSNGTAIVSAELYIP